MNPASVLPNSHGDAGNSPDCEANARSGAFLDTTEAAANALIGLAVSWAATFFVLGYSATGSIAVTAMFFALSFSRAWILRRIFRRLS